MTPRHRSSRRGSKTQFSQILQDDIMLNDSSWRYRVPSLPPPTETDPHKLVKSIGLVSNPTSQYIELSLQQAEPLRAMRDDPLHAFIVISFSSFALRMPAAGPGQKRQRAPPPDTANYIAKILKTGIAINDQEYNFYGHSTNQLQSRSCYLFAAPKHTIERQIDAMADMSKFRSIAKKVKRIGLLFISAEVTTTLNPEYTEEIDDVTRDGYVFTDGCGLLASNLAKQIAKTKNTAHRNISYVSSVFQIRYRGYKGVLMVSPALKGGKLAQFRPSMRKLDNVTDDRLFVINHSKPYAFGFLNDDIVVLLHALGITTDALLKKQNDFFDLLQAASNGDVRATFQFLSFMNYFDLGEKLLLEGFSSSISGIVRSKVLDEYSKMSRQRGGSQRCRIMIPKSRLLFGVCDPTSKAGATPKLKAGTCFVRITIPESGQAQTIVNTDVLVTRNPCLHPGDLQRFKAVEVHEFSHLVDCIVFPTVGKRPSVDLMSGGDLDGDKFIVIWDPDVMPAMLAQPADYPHPKQVMRPTNMSGDGRANYFAHYNNYSISRLKTLHVLWARLKGPMSPECQELNRLHSQSLDGFEVFVPSRLEDPPRNAGDEQPFILDVLHRAAEERIKAGKFSQIGTPDLPVDAMNLLLSRDAIAIHEFDLIQTTLKWCRRYDENLLDYAGFFNFGVLSDDQQKWLLGELPPTKSGASIVKNGLHQSHIVTSHELHRFQMDYHGFHWKRIFDSSSDRMGRFMACACQTLELFHKKLILFKPDERLVLAIYVPSKIPVASETSVGTSVRVFALPQSKGSDSTTYRVRPTTVKYRLYCDEASFWLYDDKRQNTFIYLTRGPMDNSSFENLKNKGDRRRQKQATINASLNFDCRASIALDKISKDIQDHVGRVRRAGIYAAEIYVISNRDTESMRLLDQWLEYVDTEQTLPLFEKPRHEYKISATFGNDPNLLGGSQAVRGILSGHNVSDLALVTSLSEVQQILDTTKSKGEKQLLGTIFAELLDLDSSGKLYEDARVETLVEDTDAGLHLPLLLLNFLCKAPYLTSLFLQSKTWTRCKFKLRDRLFNTGPTILTQLVLAAHSAQHAIRQHFVDLVQNLDSLVMQAFAELVELIALTVSDRELAVDLLFECLEPESGRLLEACNVQVPRFIRLLFGTALSHIDETLASKAIIASPVRLSAGEVGQDGRLMVNICVRLDAPQQLQAGDHIRMCPSQPPKDAPLTQGPTVDGIVVDVVDGNATIKCLHPLPSHVERCLWNIIHGSSFVTTKAMFDAVLMFYDQKMGCCQLYDIVENHGTAAEPMTTLSRIPRDCTEELNDSQISAVEAAIAYPCTLVWTPPGTGEALVWVSIIEQIMQYHENLKLLVTAPTHASVDSIMTAYIASWKLKQKGPPPLRVSTRTSKVSSDLWDYTCDATIPSRGDAQIRIKDARLLFTTCVGSSLGLMRFEKFDVVLIGDAAKQTMPETLIPITKGCRKAIFFGDHAQPRVTINNLASVADFDISIFEELYTSDRLNASKVMLDIQDRNDPGIGDFLSREFYDSKLRSAKVFPLPSCSFPWPAGRRMVFLQCSTPEDIGQASKSNTGQVNLCARVCELLQEGQITVLTPYAAQRKKLRRAISGISLSGSADIIIFVTVRCNPHRDIGIDRRYLTKLSQARAGVIVIGDKATLKAWDTLLNACAEVFINKKGTSDS